MKWIMLLLTLGAGAAVAALPGLLQRGDAGAQQHPAPQSLPADRGQGGTGGQYRLLLRLSRPVPGSGDALPDLQGEGVGGARLPLQRLLAGGGGRGQDRLGLPTRLRGDLPHVQPDRRARGRCQPALPGVGAAAGEAPGWNFHKYLVGRDGKLVASYGGRTRIRRTIPCKKRSNGRSAFSATSRRAALE